MYTTISAFRCVLTEIRRTYLYKMLFVVLSIVFQLSVIMAAQYDLLFAASSSTFGYNKTLFLVGNIAPTYFFLIHVSTVALVLLHDAQIRSNNALEPVYAKPFRNSSWSIGTVLGLALLVFAVPFLNFIVIYLFLTIASALGIDMFSVPELMSSINLIIVDIPVSILFYAALAMVLQRIVRHSMLGGFVALLVATMHLVLITSVPHVWKQVVSFSTSDSLVVSSVLPQFSTTGIMFNRAMWLLLAIGLVLLLGVLETRRDPRRGLYSYLTAACLISGFIGIGFHGFSVYLEGKKAQRIASQHEVSSTSSWLDLESLQGRVDITPGKLLTLQLELQVKAAGGAMPDTLQFSFNPSMRLEQLLLDNTKRDFSFQDGLIDIPLDRAEASRSEWTLSIQASGFPDVNFGYLNPHFDYMRLAGVSQQVPKILGVQNSIFSKNFVALMPGTRWYPLPMALGSEKHIQSQALPEDTYRVNVDLYVQGKDWTVAGPGHTTRLSENLLRHRILGSKEFPHLAVIASKFNSLRFEEDDVELELLVHKKHQPWSDRSKRTVAKVFSEILNQMHEFRRQGFELPYNKVTFVEVPNQLRLVGGFEMPFLYSQTGIIFIRESGLPTTNLDRMYRQLLKFNFPKEQIEPIFVDQVYDYTTYNVIGGNLNAAIIDQYVPSFGQATSPFEISLNFLQLMLIIQTWFDQDFIYAPSDIDLVTNIAHVTAIHPTTVFAKLLGRGDLYSPSSEIGNAVYRRFQESDDSFLLQSATLSQLLDGENRSLKSTFFALRLSMLFRALIGLHGREKFKNALQSLTNSESDSSNSGHESLESDLSRTKDSIVSLVNEWNDSILAPAFTTSELQIFDVSAKDSSFRQRASFKLRNDSPTTGVVNFVVFNQDYYGNLGLGVEIPGRSSFEVNLYTEELILGVTVATFYSKNMETIELFPDDPSRVVVKGDPDETIYPTLVEIDWNPNSALDMVVVDNLDPGFTLLKRNDHSFTRWIQSIHWPWESPRLTPRTVKGLETFRWSDQDLDESWRICLDSWRGMYGRYRVSAIAALGPNVETARFSAEIPISGKWSLSYWFPHSLLFNERRGTTHHFVLRQAQQETALTADLPDSGGWLDIGEFDISEPVVELDLVSVDPPNSIRVADAIKWTLKEEHKD